MKAVKFDRTGKKVGETVLPDGVFNVEVSKSAIHHVIRIENNNRRQGTHKTKTISEVSGGGKKPWRQKGTGNARQGSTRAPQWRHGATVFGPVPRDYSIRMPDKIRKAGMRSIFTAKARVNSIAVVEDIAMDSFSTKTVYNTFKTMGFLPGNTVAFISDSESAHVKKSCANIPQLRFVSAKRITAPEIFYSGQLVITESALKLIESAYAQNKKGKVGVA